MCHAAVGVQFVPDPPQEILTASAEGVHLFKQGNYQSARENFVAALELNPKDAALLYNVGQCYDRLGETGRLSVDVSTTVIPL